MADEKMSEPDSTEIQKHYRQKAKDCKDRLPADLPVEKQSCSECGTKLHIMGKEIRRELKLIPVLAG